MIIDLAEWLWDHWQEITLNALLLFILRRFIIKELSQLLRPSQTEAILSNQKVIMRVTGVESEWKSNLPMNGFKITLPQLSKKLYLFSLMDMKHPKIRRKTNMKSKLLSRKLWMAIFGALLPVINEQFNLGLNPETVIASVSAIVAYIVGQAHVDAKAAQKAPVQSDPNKFIQG